MTFAPEIVVLCGGRSSEREVSLRSGHAVSAVLPGSRLVELEADVLPDWLDGAKHVVLPVLHGGWGEDGRAQAEMEARGIAFAGCSSVANRLCMDKVATKAAMRAAGVPAIPEVAFGGSAKPAAAALVAALGEHIVIKPSDQGSSVGLYMLEGETAVAKALAEIPASGQWMAERRLRGREMSIGLLDAAGVPALGVVLNPVLEELFVGVVGRGASLNGRPMRTSGEAAKEASADDGPHGRWSNHPQPEEHVEYDMNDPEQLFFST